MEWHSYLEKWPEDGSVIIKIHLPYESYKGEFKKHYTMGMTQFNSYGLTLESFKKRMQEYGYDTEDSWWCYAKDFPFPDK